MMRTAALTLGLLVASVASAAEGQWVRSKGIVHFIIEGPFDDVHGETRQVNGALNIDPDGWAKANGSVAVDIDTVRTGIDQRDEDMRVEFLQSSRFPKAILTIEKIERASAEAIPVGGSVKGDLHGTFEVHGVRRKVTFPINITRENGFSLRAAGSFLVPFGDYSIPRPSRLFLKLGDQAKIVFDVTFVQKTVETPPAVAAVVQPTVQQVLPEAPKPKPPPKKKPQKKLELKYLFTSGDPKSRGEKLFHSEKLGGAGNKLTCFHCHTKGEDKDVKDGFIRSGRTAANSAARKVFWNGFANDPAKAAAICQKAFMLGDGLTVEQEEDLNAFLEAITPKPAVAALDYSVNYHSMEVLLQDPTGGNAANGKKLADKYCMTCHLDGRVGPVWAPGLYEPDWVVRRVRRLEGHQNRQMPNFSQARLPDDQLRDIVTYLTSPDSAPPIFKRKKTAAGIPVPGSR
ncbi:MAG: YceI family protein [Myxococcaceae bacterium]|nr:YceI family protein [Myxococcaceae bacterium]